MSSQQNSGTLSKECISAEDLTPITRDHIHTLEITDVEEEED